MISRLVRIAALVSCAFIVVSFIWFASDQAGEASNSSVVGITGEKGKPRRATSTEVPNPDRATEKRRERVESGLREFIDDGDDIFLSPFTGITNSHNVWVLRAVPTVIALFLYGFIGAMVARAFQARRL